MAELMPKGPFRKADISRNNDAWANRNVSKDLEAEYGLDPTALTCDFGTPEFAEGLGVDPMDRQMQGEFTNTNAPACDGPKVGKRTSGADPTPGMPGA